MPTQHDADTPCLREGRTLVAPRAHGLVRGDQCGLGVRAIRDPLDKRYVLRPPRCEVESMEHFKRVRHPRHFGFGNQLHGVGDNARRILVEDDPHAASGSGALTPKVNRTA